MVNLVDSYLAGSAEKRRNEQAKYKRDTDLYAGKMLLGDQGAGEQLARFNPEAYMKVGSQMQQQMQRARQQQMQMSQAQRESYTGASGYMQETNQMLNKLAPEQRDAFLAQRGQRGSLIYGDAFSQLQPTAPGVEERTALGTPDPGKPQIKIGINPETGKREYVSIGTDGEPDFLGVEAPKTSPLVQIGQGDVTKAVKSKLQTGVVETRENIASLDRIMGDFKPEYLTYGGAIGASITAVMEKLGGIPDKDRKEFLRGRTAFKNGVEQFFNQYRKEITGAAAAEKELARLEKTMINTKMSTTEFKASMNLLRKKLASVEAIKAKFLEQGLDVSKEEMTNAINQAVMNVRDFESMEQDDIDMLQANDSPEMREYFIDAFGTLPEGF